MPRQIVKIDWEETEQGFGCRPDGTSLHINMVEAERFIQEHWSKYPKGDAPAEYSRPSKPEFVFVNNDLFDYVQHVKSWWVTHTIWWGVGKPYAIPSISPNLSHTPHVTVHERLTNMPKNIDQYTIKELEDILKKKLGQLPQPISPAQRSYDALFKCVATHMESHLRGTDDADDKQYIFEEVLKAIYGKDIFEWYNRVGQ